MASGTLMPGSGQVSMMAFCRFGERLIVDVFVCTRLNGGHGIWFCLA